MRSSIEARATCRIDYLRLGRPTSTSGELVALSSNGGTISCAKLLPVGQKTQIVFPDFGDDAVGAQVIGCKAVNEAGYHVAFKLTESAWPYALYAKLANQTQAARGARASTSAPACLVSLGLGAHATREDVENAFGDLVRRAHPDRGGAIDDFVKLRRAYLEAMQLLGGRR